jgi:CelD/BcsL family acetyltransferase involved in cellulose biosynthesis
MNSQPHLGIEIHIERLPDLGHLEAEWVRLDQIGKHSFFQSWGWVGPWLRASPEHLDIALIRAVRCGLTVGLAVLTRRSKQFYGLIPVRQGWLNASGDAQYDRLTVEHNGFATTEQEPQLLASAVIAQFSQGSLQIDELILPWMDSPWPTPGSVLARKHQELGFRRNLSGRHADREALGSRNTRQQLSRAVRRCEAYGKLELRRAEGLAQKLCFFTELKELHQNSWRKRNRQNAFDNRYFEPFCREMFEADRSDEVDLLRLCAGSTLLGVLLNFRRAGIVYNYQSGFDDSKPSLRPGYVAHAEAIRYYARIGQACYDFLGQPNQLKRSLCTDSYPLHWQTLQRPTRLFKLERLARNLLKPSDLC